MAYNYQYSKPFSQNGAPVATVDLRKDLIGVSVPTTVSATAPWGHISKDKTLEAFQKYFFAEVKLDGIGTYGIFKEGGGIIGAGTTADPIRVDQEWMTDRYIPSFNFPVSQVGDPSDFLLPISGSYFSVTFPLGNLPYHATAFVEGNGDLRLLHHVTNGEELRPVYALWKDYKNNLNGAMQITDVVYRPPGLDANEFIHNVYPASESAMAAVLYREQGFQEHVIILLNGTMAAQYHQVIRLGHQVFTVMLESVFSYTALRNIDAMSLNAIIGTDGKIYLGLPLTPRNTQTNAVSSIVVARCDIAADGSATLVPLTNTTTTNHMGGVTNYPGNGFIMHHKHTTTDRTTDKDALFLTSDDITWYTGTDMPGYAPGVSPPQSLQFSSLTEDGKIILTMRYYHWCNNSTAGTRNIKPIFYYLLDPVNRSLTAIPDSSGNKEWGVVFNAAHALEIIAGGKSYYGGHYVAGGSIYQLLPDGTRVIHVTPGSSDVLHTLEIHVSDNVNTALDGAKDSVFVETAGRTRGLNPVPPTPLLANRGAWLMYNNLIAYSGPFNGTVTRSPLVRAKLLGGSTDKEYRLLQVAAGSAPVTFRGYVLNNDRTACSGTLLSKPFCFVENNVAKYHTGYWCTGVKETDHVQQYDFSDLIENGKPYRLAQSVIDQMDGLREQIIPNDPEFSNQHGYSWSLVGPHPSTTNKKCLIRYVISHYKDNPALPPFFKEYNGIWQGIALVPCTVVVDGDGAARITTVDISKIPLNPTLFTSAQDIIGSGAGNLGFAGGVIQIQPNGEWWCNWTSNGNSGNIGGTGFATREAYSVGFDSANTILWSRAGGITVNTPTWHPTLGFGYVFTTDGLGAMYRFIPLTERLYSDPERESVILTSARPAAGFSMTVSADIPIYSRGSLKYVRQQILDLRNTKADPRWSVFYISAEVTASEDAELIITLDAPVDTENRIYLGKIVTNETEITEMVLEPVTRWESKRTSTNAVGSAIIVSTGHPGAPGDITAISAGIDPTRSQGGVLFNSSDTSVTITGSGSFYIQDKDLAISRFGNFEQFFMEITDNRGRCWLNGEVIQDGATSSTAIINRNDILRTGWNTVAINSGVFKIRGPFLKR